MKVTITTIKTFDLSDKQIELLKRLSEDSEYLHGDEADLADKTIGIYDSGEGKYGLTSNGWKILGELKKLI